MKITEQQIKKIKDLKEEGTTQKVISKILELPTSTISYYSSKENRERASKYQKEYHKKNPQKRGDKYREYQRIYHNKRYWRLKDIKQNEKGGKKDEKKTKEQ